MSESKVGFLSVLKGTFTGLDIFPKLLNNSWWRTFLYLIIFIIFLSLIVGFMQCKRLKPTINALEIILVENFGNDIISDNKNHLIYPANNPEKSRQAVLQNLCAVYYPGKSGIKEIPAIEPNIFAIWHPDYIIVGTKHSAGNIISTKFYFDHFNNKSQNYNTVGSLASLLKETSKVDFTQLTKQLDDKTVQKFDFSTITYLIYKLLFISLVIQNIFTMATHVILLTAVFSFMYNLSAKNKELNVVGTKLWKLGIYASFPVLVVAAAFPALDLPFLSFSTVYMIGLVIYWLRIISYTEKAIILKNYIDEQQNK